jgi:hypothetical protein
VRRLLDNTLKEKGTARFQLREGQGLEAISPDGRTMVTFGDWEYHAKRSSVKLWDMHTGQLRRTLTIADRGLQYATFDRSAKYLILLFREGPTPFVRAWDVASGLETSEIMGSEIRLPSGPLQPDYQISPIFLADGAILVLRDYGRRDLARITTTTIWSLTTSSCP